MTTEPWVIAALLAAALIHAMWNAVLKSSGSRMLSMATITASSALFALPLVFVFPLPAPEAWPYLIASVILHLGYFIALILAYRHGDLSTAYPVARGCAPLFVTLGAAVAIGQVLTPLETFGVVMISCGISMFAFEKGLPQRHTIKPFATAITVSLFIGAYTVVDGIGLRNTPQSLSYIGWLFVLEGIPLIAYVSIVHGARYRAHLRDNWKPEVVGGALSMVAYALVLFVLAFSVMAHVSALRETSVLFAVLIGAYKLKERFGLFRWSAAIIVTTGIIVMHAGG